jgi:murein DD-endopeptidase MepM/ murein hydrolase activator NlpD
MSKFDVHLADAQRSRFLACMIALIIGVLVIAGIFAALSDREPSSQQLVTDDQNVELAMGDNAAQLAQLDQSEFVADPVEAAPTDLVTLEHEFFSSMTSDIDVERTDARVRRGQTFASVLDDIGASRLDAARAISALQPLFSARDLRAGQTLSVFMETVPELGEDGDVLEITRLAGLSFRPDSERTLTVSRTGDTFMAREATQSLRRELVRARGEVDSSLYMAALNAGATDRIVVELANILGFAVDFRTIQPGDDFDIVFERFVNRRGETMRTGQISYLYFDGRGDPLEYYRFEDSEGIIGYYSGEGESARRLLMKMPLNGARVTSSFGMRFHPVLATNRPHNGIDFGAPVGTPIYAAGAGIVERSNRFGSFGNYVRIRHANGYKTIYAHLRGFARGIRSGSRVQQGQTIGYLGATGRVTGPHLHYEVHRNGRPLNPMSLNLPTGKTLSDEELVAFQAERDRIAAIRDEAPLANGNDLASASSESEES